MTDVYIFTDGSSRGNPGPGGWGVVMQIETSDATDKNARVLELGGHESKTTNNRMELAAVTSGLEVCLKLARSEKSADFMNIHIFLDSAYVLNGAKSWLAGWKRKDWTTSTKSPVLNKDLWQEFDVIQEHVLAEGADISWHKVAGHADIVGNERCDVIATSFADKTPISLFDGVLHNYSLPLVLKEGGLVSPTQAVSHGKSRSKKSHETGSAPKIKKSKPKGPAYSYVSEINGEVMVHGTWDECKDRVHGKKARFQRAESASEETALIKKWGRG